MVTEGALVPICKTPPLTLVPTSAVVEEPEERGRRGRTQGSDSLMVANQKVSDARPESAALGWACVHACVHVWSAGARASP